MALTSFFDWKKNIFEASLPQDKETITKNIPSIYPYSDADTAVIEASKREPIFKNMLQEALKRGANNKGYILTDIKKLDSIQRKVDTKKKQNPNFNVTNLTDILRGSIVTDNDHNLTEGVAKYIYNHYQVISFEHKSSPKDKDRTGYHGTYHLDINLNGMPCEIQILTKAQKSIKAVSDDAYKVSRVGQEVDPEIYSLLSRKFRKATMPPMKSTGRPQKSTFKYNPEND